MLFSLLRCSISVAVADGVRHSGIETGQQIINQSTKQSISQTTNYLFIWFTYL